MKKVLVYLLKCGLAVIISVVLLSLFSLVYYNPPIATEQSDFITNSKFVPGQKWSYMLEGVGFGKINNQGYNSAYYDDCTDPDIVFMGSSHMEALNVPQDSNCVYLLNQKFDKDDLPNNNYKIVNLGVSGHFFEVSASNFCYVADKFKGAKYVVVEIFDAEYSPDVLDDIIEGRFHEPFVKNGFLHTAAQKIPFFRLLYKKINETKHADPVPAEVQTEEVSDDMDAYREKMNIILKNISEKADENGIEPIVLMHNRFWLDEDGNIVTEMDEDYKNAFKQCCAETGITIIDATPAMIDHYNKTFEFSYGFSNSAPGEGHLNKTGHRIIAETVYEQINEMEKDR